MRLFDSHAHLDDDKFDEDREELIMKIKQSEIANFISAGYSIEASIKALELAKKYSFIYATVGISPNDIPQTNEQLLNNIKKIDNIVKNELENQNKSKNNSINSNINNRIIRRSNVNDIAHNQLKIENKDENLKKNKNLVAIGEIGLDYYWEKDIKKQELQKKAFKMQIEIANKYNLPIVIHTREAVMDTLDILKKNEVKKKGVFHCCPQNRELIKEALKLGFYISFAGPITFKNSKNAEEIINLVPNDRLLIETDSPYLAPEPVRGTRNDPRNVKYIADKIAVYKNISLEQLAEMTFANTRKIFNI